MELEVPVIGSLHRCAGARRPASSVRFPPRHSRSAEPPTRVFPVLCASEPPGRAHAPAGSTRSRRSRDATQRLPETPGRRCDRGSEWANALRLHPLRALLGLVRHLLPLEELAVPGTLDGREVCEDVGGPIVRGDEPEALRGVEPFDGAFRHALPLFSPRLNTCGRPQRQPPTHTASVTPRCAVRSLSATSGRFPHPLPFWQSAG